MRASTAPRAAHRYPRVRRGRPRDAFVSHIEDDGTRALCPPGIVPLPTHAAAVGAGDPNASKDDWSGPEADQCAWRWNPGSRPRGGPLQFQARAPLRRCRPCSDGVSPPSLPPTRPPGVSLFLSRPASSEGVSRRERSAPPDWSPGPKIEGGGPAAGLRLNSAVRRRRWRCWRGGCWGGGAGCLPGLRRGGPRRCGPSSRGRAGRCSTGWTGRRSLRARVRSLCAALHVRLACASFLHCALRAQRLATAASRARAERVRSGSGATAFALTRRV